VKKRGNNDCNLLDFPLAMHISQATLDAVLRDLITSLHHYGIQKIVILNGHGGNDFSPFIRQIQTDMDVHVFQIDWWKVGMDKYHDIFDTEDDHAGEVETSVALALYPELVEMQYAQNARNAVRTKCAESSVSFYRAAKRMGKYKPSLCSFERLLCNRQPGPGYC